MRSHTLIKSFNLVVLSFFLLLLACSKDSGSAPAPSSSTVFVEIKAGEGGTVTFDTQNVVLGRQVRAEAIPNEGYEFVHWEANGACDGNGLLEQTSGTNYLVTQNPLNQGISCSGLSYTAIFAPSTYSLSVNVVGQGNVNEQVISSGKSTEYESENTEEEIALSKKSTDTVLESSKNEVASTLKSTDYDKGSVVRLTATPSSNWIFTNGLDLLP